MSILTGVNMRMALEFESNVPDVPEMNEKKQIGSIVSTLTRLLYFYTWKNVILFDESGGLKFE